MLRLVMFVLVLGLLPGGQWAEAGEVKIVGAVAKHEHGSSGNSYRFDVTLEHNDEGWDHYADRWEVWTPDGKDQLAVRVLLHPHEQEQPFTRFLDGVEIPGGLTQVLIRAHDSKHGESPQSLRIDLPKPK
jgi:hypothetical protein